MSLVNCQIKSRPCNFLWSSKKGMTALGGRVEKYQAYFLRPLRTSKVMRVPETIRYEICAKWPQVTFIALTALQGGVEAYFQAIYISKAITNFAIVWGHEAPHFLNRYHTNVKSWSSNVIWTLRWELWRKCEPIGNMPSLAHLFFIDRKVKNIILYLSPIRDLCRGFPL